MAKITVGLLRQLEGQVARGEISYSRMVEILNEKKQEPCPSCGSDEVVIVRTVLKLNRCEDCGVEWDINE
jgi:predicted RNA-binding Zn-ribbon protein involved in translation (DUF1610 family)